MEKYIRLIELTISPIWSFTLIIIGITLLIPHFFFEVKEMIKKEKTTTVLMILIATIFIVIIVWIPRYYRIHMDEAYYAQMAINFKWHYKCGINFLGDWSFGYYLEPFVQIYQQQPLGPVLMSFFTFISALYPGHILNIFIGFLLVITLICFINKTNYNTFSKISLFVSTLFLFETVFWFRSGALEPLAATFTFLILYLIYDYKNLKLKHKKTVLIALIGVLPYCKADMILIAGLLALIFISILYDNKEREISLLLIFFTWLFALFHLFLQRNNSWGPAGPHGTFSIFHFKKNIVSNFNYLTEYGPGHALILILLLIAIISIIQFTSIYNKKQLLNGHSRITICLLGLLLISSIIFYNSFYAGSFKYYGINHRYLVPQYFILIGSVLFISKGFSIKFKNYFLSYFLIIYLICLTLEIPGTVSKSFAPGPMDWWLRKDVEHIQEIRKKICTNKKDCVIIGAIPQIAIPIGISVADINCIYNKNCKKRLCIKYNEIYIYSGPWTLWLGPSTLMKEITNNTWDSEKFGFSIVYERKIKDRIYRLWKSECF
jgi:hypothetical protein